MEELIKELVRVELAKTLREEMNLLIKSQMKDIIKELARDKERKENGRNYSESKEERRERMTAEILNNPYISKNVGANYYTHIIIYTTLEFLDRDITEAKAVKRLGMTRYDFMKIWHCLAVKFLYPTDRTLYPHIIDRI